jgi:hypothetical protein
MHIFTYINICRNAKRHLKPTMHKRYPWINVYARFSLFVFVWLRTSTWKTWRNRCLLKMKVSGQPSHLAFFESRTFKKENVHQRPVSFFAKYFLCAQLLCNFMQESMLLHIQCFECHLFPLKCRGIIYTVFRETSK